MTSEYLSKYKVEASHGIACKILSEPINPSILWSLFLLYYGK